MLSIALLYHQEDPDNEALHLDYKRIEILDFVPPKFQSVYHLYLSHNKLKSLSGIESFRNLKVLHFRFNQVGHFEELLRVGNGFFLESLALTGNPLEFDRKCKEDNIRAIFKNLKEYNPSYERWRQKQGHTHTTTRNQYQQFHTPGKHTQSVESGKQKYVQSITSNARGSPYMITKRIANKAGFHNQSTKRQSMETRRQLSFRKQFDIQPFSSPQDEPQSLTARFKPQFFLEENSQLTIDLIEEQNDYLAQAYHCRSLVQKCFDVLKSLGCQKSVKFFSSRLKLKVLVSLQASVQMRRVQRHYSIKRQQILNHLVSQP